MEEFPFALRDYLLFGFKKLLFFSCIAGGSIFVFDQYFESPADRVRERELQFMETELEQMASNVTEMGVILRVMVKLPDSLLIDVSPVKILPLGFKVETAESVMFPDRNRARAEWASAQKLAQDANL
jgi:hypothetical protein